MANNSDVIFQSYKSKKVSSLVQAMRGWETDLASSGTNVGGQFGRVVKITTSGLTLTNDLDLEFVVPFDDDSEPNEAEIKIYNLTKNTVSKLKVDNEISITAGYGSDTGVIFDGVISTVKTKWEDKDKITTITAIDSVKQEDQNICGLSFSKGVKASYVLQSLVGMLGLPIAVFKIRQDRNYPKGVTISGSLWAAINQYAEVCGVSAYINKRKVYVQNAKVGENLGFTVNEDTGLIGSPEEFSEEGSNTADESKVVSGIKFKMLLEHRVTTASIIKLKSRDYSGQYRVREGQHVCNESDFYTEITAIY